MKTALFPGSFDPFHIGHKAIVDKALKIFDELVIGFALNSEKIEARQRNTDLVEFLYKDNSRVRVAVITGLVVDYCKTRKIGTIIKGLRSTEDFEYEQNMAMINKSLNWEVQTIFIPCDQELVHISSSMIRELKKHNQPVTKYLP